MSPELSILCVTNELPRTNPFIQHYFDVAVMLKLHDIDAEVVIARDGKDVHSQGYIESALDEAVALTSGRYVLRIDDDERISPAMARWLSRGEFRAAPNWTFPRVHFWRDVNTVIFERYYFPDPQTRLSVRQMAGGNRQIHSASPYGSGETAKVCLEHHVYLVKSYEERIETAKRYNAIMHGGDGGQYRASAIEDEHPEGLNCMSYEDGAIPWKAKKIFIEGPLR